MDERQTVRRKKVTEMMAPDTRAPHEQLKPAEQPLPLPNDVQAFIGRELRAVYDNIVNEPVPDRFVKLLEELERKHGGKS